MKYVISINIVPQIDGSYKVYLQHNNMTDLNLNFSVMVSFYTFQILQTHPIMYLPIFTFTSIYNNFIHSRYGVDGDKMHIIMEYNTIIRYHIIII